MTNSVLYYFVDTNLFLQCHPLEQLDWSPWNTFEEVRLIVSKPILREIDYRKNKGNDRAGRRARATSAMLRETLNSKHTVVHVSNPRVVLCVEPHHQYSKDLEDLLDYQGRDDQLIGTAYEFARRNQSCSVRLLTHDTTPVFTARSLNLPTDVISDDWLLPPETTETEKELASLKAENARLKKAEPSISIRCIGQSDSLIERYEATYKWFGPLTNQQIEELMQRLRGHFPLATDFGPTEPQERIAPQTVLDRFLGTKQVLTPATADEIAKYRDEAYPQWLERCEQVFRQHHLMLQEDFPVLEFSFLAENVGTRPAADALVTIEARGSFQIVPPSPEDEDEQPHGAADETRVPQPRKLRTPPDPPTGRWQTVPGSNPHDPLRVLNTFGRSLSQFSALARNLEGGPHHPFVVPPIFEPTPHDPNAFYYKPKRPSIPQDSFLLECDQWRHDNEEESFPGEIHVSPDQDGVEGALVCRIQAGNLSKTASKHIPVRITTAHVSAFESARSMVEALVATSRP